MRVVFRRQPASDDEPRVWSLTLGREYTVIGIADDYYQIVDDTDDPVLFHQSCFDIVDATEPAFWVSDYGDEGERYAGPAEWSKVGFFEDYHDGVEAVRRQFWSDYRRLYGDAIALSPDDGSSQMKDE